LDTKLGTMMCSIEHTRMNTRN